MNVFEPYKIKSYTFKNRLIMPPMCMYQAKDGKVNDFHVIHYGTRAYGGVSLIIQEATAVQENGQITKKDLGIWNDAHTKGLKRIVKAIHQGGALAGIQISHAGRKAKDQAVKYAPSAIAFNGQLVPKEMTIEEIKETIKAFQEAAIRADQAGYDLLEIHAAHGYLIHQFISPLSNKRSDEYQAGLKFLEDILEAVTKVWPKEKILQIRISSNEYHPQGLMVDDWIKYLKKLEKYNLDLIHVSTGGLVVTKIDAFEGYQVSDALKIKKETGYPVIAGGLITTQVFSNHVIEEGADLVYLGRLLLRDPYALIKWNQSLLHPSYERSKR